MISMRQKSVWAVLGILAVACSPVSPASSHDEADLVAATNNWVGLYNANDWPGLAAEFTPDAVMMPPNSPAVTGRAAIAAWEAENESGFQIALKAEDINVEGDTAIIRGRSCVFIPLDGDEVGVDIGKYLEVRRRTEDGEWLIVQDIFNSDLPPGGDLASSCPADIQGPEG